MNTKSSYLKEKKKELRNEGGKWFILMRDEINKIKVEYDVIIIMQLNKDPEMVSVCSVLPYSTLSSPP